MACCIHVTNAVVGADNSLTFTLSNSNEINAGIISTTISTNPYATSGVVAGTTLTFTRNDSSTFPVDVSSLVNTYTGTTGIVVTGTVITLDNITSSGTGTSIIKTAAGPYVLKDLIANNHVTITSTADDIIIGLSDFTEYDIIAAASTTTVTNERSIIRILTGVVSAKVELPLVTSVTYNAEFHIYAGGTGDVIEVGSNAVFLDTISSPYDYTNFVITHVLQEGEYYIVRKHSNAAYIIIKQ